MNRLMIATLAALTLAGSVGAASAQSRHADNGYGYGYAPNFGQRLTQIDRRIERGARSGDLTRREAALLRRDLDVTARLEQRYGHDGFSRWEIVDLSRRVDALQARVRFERRDPEERYDRDDRDDRYDDDHRGRDYGRNRY